MQQHTFFAYHCWSHLVISINIEPFRQNLKPPRNYQPTWQWLPQHPFKRRSHVRPCIAWPPWVGYHRCKTAEPKLFRENCSCLQIVSEHTHCMPIKIIIVWLFANAITADEKSAIRILNISYQLLHVTSIYGNGVIEITADSWVFSSPVPRRPYIGNFDPELSNSSRVPINSAKSVEQFKTTAVGNKTKIATICKALQRLRRLSHCSCSKVIGSNWTY
jgi:hypothetical protein